MGAHQNKLKEMLNNYVFNNPIKIIFNQKMYDYQDSFKDLFNSKLEIHKLSTKPFKFTIKSNLRERLLSFPNGLIYFIVANKVANELVKYDNHRASNSSQVTNRLLIDADNRKLKPKNYSQCLQRDKMDLKVQYECLSFFDISNFYGSIYTHCFERIEEEFDINKKGSKSNIDIYVRSLNNKKTKGLLLGNLLSLYCANEIMFYLSNQIHAYLIKEKIYHKIEYFSDQFYIKHNRSDAEYIFNTVKKILGTDYFEFMISEQKYKLLSFKDLVLQSKFNNSISQIKNNFDNKNKEYCDNNYIVDNEQKLKHDYENIPTNNKIDNILHVMNSIIHELVSDNIDNQLKEIYIKVLFRNFFASPVNLYYLYEVCNTNAVVEVASGIFFIILQYPTVSYDLFQLSIFEAIKFRDYLTDEKMNILYKSLKNSSIDEHIFIYWFLKVLIKSDKLLKDYESLPDIDNSRNSILFAFLITNAIELIDENMISYLEQIIKNSEHLFNENWLLFYQYALTNKSTIPNCECNEKNKIIEVANNLIKKGFSFINEIEKLEEINEIASKNKMRWNEDKINQIPTKLSQYKNRSSTLDKLLDDIINSNENM